MAKYGDSSGYDSEGGESYFQSVSDLMAALIFVFILTVAVFALRLAQTRQEVESLLDRVRNDRTELLVDLRERLKERGIEVLVEPDQGILRIRENGVYFPSGAAWPAAEFTSNVGVIAHVLAQTLPCYVAESRAGEPTAQPRPAYCTPTPAESVVCADAERARVETLLIEGHTDPRPVRGGFRDNLELSAARAAQIFRMMSECEPSLEGLYNSQRLRVVGVSGYAERRPVSTIDDENRRIDLRFMMELPSLEGRQPPQPAAASQVTEEIQRRIGP